MINMSRWLLQKKMYMSHVHLIWGYYPTPTAPRTKGCRFHLGLRHKVSHGTFCHNLTLTWPVVALLHLPIPGICEKMATNWQSNAGNLSDLIPTPKSPKESEKLESVSFKKFLTLAMSHLNHANLWHLYGIWLFSGWFSAHLRSTKPVQRHYCIL